ncbi:MAG: VCBS repeat-containing protein, partial [Ideonella sp.]|nr:VCBS repeat-containing protein [Ideonella sp.]
MPSHAERRARPPARRPRTRLRAICLAAAACGAIGSLYAAFGTLIIGPQAARALDTAIVFGHPRNSAGARRVRALASTDLPTFARFVPHAPFLGNQSVLLGGIFPTPTAPLFSLLLRETDCSLTLNAIANVSSNGGTILARLPGAERQLRALASGSGSAAGAFVGGCGARTRVTQGAEVTYLGRIGDELLMAYPQPDGTLISLRATPTGRAIEAVTLATQAGATVVGADLNGDGIADLVTPWLTHAAGTGPAVLLGRADGSFASPLTYPVYQGGGSRFYAGAAVADLDGDGRPDILALNVTPGGGPARLVSLINQGGGTFAAGPTQDIAYVIGPRFALGDVDGDGRLDMLTSDGQLLLGTGGGAFG